MSNAGVTIIKKRQNKDSGLSHGGWKVAMADLMISMMCLFLILWLLSVMDTKDSSDLVEYFQTGKLQTDGLGNSISPIPLQEVATTNNESDMRRIDDNSLIEGEVDSQQELEVFARLIEEHIEEIQGMGSVQVTVTPQGLKILISDSAQGQMFYRGGANMTPYYQDLLLHLAPVFKRVTNAMVITGHTDAARYAGAKTTNWELSANRANQARYFLAQGGVPNEQIFQVSGMADTAPVNFDDPKSADNRRIEVFILTSTAQKQLSQVYKNLPKMEAAGKDVDQKAMDKIGRQEREAAKAALDNQLPISY
ncbi:OmpA family protein [Vibrio ziniensis]|uniref:OmpA family protein n=1 Tax=Vibrio ziniensis TaxID=2711221 RepID=A0A6G7CHF6_9VIBR|nr:OmpA family protein [Vibrio ziniensis]QIH41503.1 OmpA family protein [Vibrio ziniensis]